MIEILIKFSSYPGVIEKLIDSRELLKAFSNSINLDDHSKETKLEIIKAISDMCKIVSIKKEIVNILISAGDGQFLNTFLKMLIENNVII